MNIVPMLTVDEPNPPMFAITWSTSGSWRTSSTSCSCRAFIAGNEMSCGPRAWPLIIPVSCSGNSPNGISR
jgi:hypothetical protein